MPTISAGALKRMLHLPANVVIGTPRVERDRAGREIVVVPVRPYARDMGRCAECGGHGRPYDRLPTLCFVKLGWAVSACFLVRLSGCF
ncbi:hypothetical protein BCAL_0106 [Bifidobacterium callitrichos DSM 23973]|uniref:Uncharacterized protein n=1 Tax=Bifidobacterium callitrichos DSM 23973 TaxID=1437609 RepID=A0A087ACL3_9BIFI|nr:hypothetical protein BCAL_0106 [Bifidobacterium callitrichos DSM 23973]